MFSYLVISLRSCSFFLLLMCSSALSSRFQCLMCVCFVLFSLLSFVFSSSFSPFAACCLFFLCSFMPPFVFVVSLPAVFFVFVLSFFEVDVCVLLCVFLSLFLAFFCFVISFCCVLFSCVFLSCSSSPFVCFASSSCVFF